MRFSDLPRRLRIYILANVLAMLPLGYLVYRSPRPDNPWLVAALVLFTIIFSCWKVELTVLQAKMTLTFAVVCLAVLLQGLQVAVPCAILGAILSSYVRPVKGSWKPQWIWSPLHMAAFNVGNCGTAAMISGLAYQWTVLHGPLSDSGTVLGLIIFTTCYFLVNTLGVSKAISLDNGLSWSSVWRQNFLWTAPGYFASASAAAGIRGAFHLIGAWSLTFLPWLYIIYYSYQLYMERLHKDMSHIQELNKLNRAIIASLATAIDAKDRYTCSHINRVHHYAVAVASEMKVSNADLEAIATGALVHDIGKLGIPDRILGKPGKLTPDEFKRIQSHVTIGTEILSPIPFPFPVVDVVRSHHERWDGLGYPNGLKGEEIPIGGRIVAVVDVFDALTSNRPYRRAMTEDEAVQVLRESAGKQFDPKVVEAFERILPTASAEIAAMEQEAINRADRERSAEEGDTALERISQAAAEMAAVCDVAHSLAEQDTLEGVMTVVVNRALALLPVDTAVLYLQAPEGSGLVAAAVEGKYHDKLRGMTIQSGEGVSGWVAANQQPSVNVTASLDVARRFGPEENVELNAATAVPLVHGPDTPGVLTVYTTAYNLLSENHLHVLNILAEHAATAILNLRRFEQHREMAYTDPLTGLVNSRSLLRQIDRQTRSAVLCGDGVGAFSLVMLDLDGFKNVNDQLGHLRGDDLLRSVADALTRIARPEDVVCRYAGDEFVVLLLHAGADQAHRIGERLRLAIDHIGPVDGRVDIGTSIGIAVYGTDGTDARALLNVADRRMYEDKFERRGRRLLEGVSSEYSSLARVR